MEEIRTVKNETRNSICAPDEPQVSSSISPSDIGQSYVRVGIVSVIIIWTYVNENPSSIDDVLGNPMLAAMPAYFLYCLGFLVLSLKLEGIELGWNGWRHLKRIVGLFVDLISCGLYIMLAGDYGLAIYPVYVTIIVGYGLRYGIFYVILAITVAVTTFTIAAVFSPLLREFKGLMAGFYLGLILVPSYAAILLKKYQDLLNRLAEINAARARFIANMSHELRTPLHAIIGNSEVISEKLESGALSKENHAQLAVSARMVTEASEHLRSLVDGVLDIASSDAGTFVLGEPSKTDLFHLVSSAIAITKPNSRSKQFSFRWFIDPSTPRMVRTWDKHLKAILINIIGNAVKYTDSGSVSVFVSVSDGDGDEQTRTVRFRITDTGVGISDSQLETIYEPFVIGDDSRARRFEGTGLGLTIAKRYLHEMGGSIDIDSELGKGTVALVSLPVTVLDEVMESTTDTSQYSAIFIPSGDDSTAVDWLATCGLDFGVAAWENDRLVTDHDLTQLDLIFIEEGSAVESSTIVDRLAKYSDNAVAILVATKAPADLNESGPIVSWVRLGNEQHLKNVLSLVALEKSPKPISAAVRHSILVVDDNQTNLQSAEIALSSYGHDVWVANDGQEALSMMLENKFDLIFMDMHMPGRSGVDLSKEYAAKSPAPDPIVMLTADATKAASIDAKIPEIASFLTKPIKPSELQFAVETYADKSGASDITDTAKAADHKIPNMIISGSFSRENYQELHNSGVDKRTLEGLVQKFIDDAFATIDQLALAAKIRDVRDMKRKLHKLKGAAAAMHIDGLSDAVDHFQRLDDESLCQQIPVESARMKQSVSIVTAGIRHLVRGLAH